MTTDTLQATGVVHPRRPVTADRTEALLAAHVPLSLLLDLLDPRGPHSTDLFAAEGACLEWVPTQPG